MEKTHHYLPSRDDIFIQIGVNYTQEGYPFDFPATQNLIFGEDLQVWLAASWKFSEIWGDEYFEDVRFWKEEFYWIKNKWYDQNLI